MKRLLPFIGLILLVQSATAQTAYTWNGSVSASWNVAGNWTPNGIPGTLDNVKIVTATNNCQLAANTSISTINLTSGTLDLGGSTLTVGGSTAQFSTGTVQNGTITVSGAASTAFGNGPVTMNCTTDITSGTITFKNTTFQGATTITKTGASNDGSAGGNVFNASAVITNAGAGYLLLANGTPDQFNSSVTFNNTGSNQLYVAYNSSGNIFNGTVTFNNASTTNSWIYVSQNSAGTTFNDSLVVNSTSGAGIQFDGGGAATSTLAAGQIISIGTAGFSAGTLLLRQFTQTGATAQNITLTGTANLTFGPSATFGGNVTATSPTFFLNGCTFNGTTNLTKTGTTGDYNNGGNTFNGVCAITNSGSSYWLLGNVSPDIWNSDVTFTDNGSERLLPCWATAGNQFNGNINVNTAGSALGIQFCGGNTTATATLAAGKTIQAGSGGLTAGFLYLKQFTQAGSAAINLTATGTSVVYLGPSSNFGGTVTVTAPDIFFNGSTFNGNVNATKTGSANDGSTGGNIFQDSTTINLTGAGYMTLGNSAADTWNNYVLFNASGSSVLGVAWGSAGNTFNGNIAVSSTGSATGIQFCGGNTTATATLASGYSILTGPAGFSSGTLLLRQFTQLGTAPTNITLTGATTLVQMGPLSTIGGNFTVVSPRILLQTTVFSDSVSLTKTGSTGEWSYGGNTFNSTLTVNQQGSGYFGFANGAPDIYNGDVYANNNSTERIIFGNNPVGNQFNGNIILTQTGSSVGIALGFSARTNETMAAGKTISIGAAGFNTGYLQIERFTQLGSTAMNLPLTGTASLTFGPSSTIGGSLTSTSATLFFNGCTFMDSVNCTKTGSTNDNSSGNNIFNGVTTVTDAGSGYLLLGNGNPDQFNGTSTFNNTGSSNFYVAYNSPNNVFGGVATFNNAPSGGTMIYVSTYSASTVFNSNIVVTSTNGAGVQFCSGNTTAAATLAAGNTISVGAGGFSAGTLLLRQFTQTGATAQSLTLTGTSNLTFGPSSGFGGNVTAVSPTLLFNGCTFAGTVAATKNGSTSDASSGNNIFNDVTTITNAGSGYLLFGNGNPDQFNNTSTFNNTGSNNLYVAYNSANNVFGGLATFNNTPATNNLIYVSSYSAGTIFNGNIVVTSTNGQGVQFCTGNTTATATLAAGNTISVGAGGFSAGTLLLRQFTQTGATAQNLTLTGTGNLTFGPSSSIGGNITTVSPTLQFDGCTFGGTVTATKNGTTSDWSTGNNVFDGPFTVTNTGSGFLLMGNGNPDLWQSTATFNNFSSASHMYVAYNSTGNTFNGDVTFNNQPGSTGLWIFSNTNGPNTQFNGNIFVENINGAGVYFGQGTGSATLGGSGSVSAGSAGFTSGGLVFQNFTQSNAGAAQNITLTGTAYIQYGISNTFNGPVTSSSPGLLFNGSTFNGTVSATKTGTSNDASTGNNTFNGVSTFTDNGTGYLLLSNSGPDVYNGNTLFVQSNTGRVYPDYNYNGTYASNVTVTSPAATAITFGAGNGTATFAGTAGQSIGVTPGTPVPVFARLVIDNTGSGVTLTNSSISVSNNLVMSAGLLNTTTSYLLIMLNGSSTAAGNALSTSYVNGPMQYQKSSSGVSTLNFPIGTSQDCRPIVLTINHSSTTLYSYQAQLFDASAAALGYTLPPSVDQVSGMHYYTIARTNSTGVNTPATGLSGNQTIQVFFGANDVVTNGGTLTIVKTVYTAPGTWINIGGMGGPSSNGTDLTGSITSTSSPTAFNSFSTFALADQIGGGNVLPIELLYFKALPDNNVVDLQWATSTESNNSYFTIQKSKDAVNFVTVEKVPSLAPDGNSAVQLDYTAQDPNPYSGVSYYRLVQTDQNGNEKYSTVVSVDFLQTQSVNVYPNPARNILNVTGLNVNSTSMQVQWFDLSGKVVGQGTTSVAGGIATLNVSPSNGYYLLKLIAPDGSVTVHNVIILK